MNSNKKSFLLHIDSLDILDELTNEQAGILFKAICAFQKGEEIELDVVCRIAFSQFKNQFIRDNEKYDLTCKRRAEAGSKGGQAKASKSKQSVAIAKTASKSKQSVANVADSNNGTKTKSDNKTNSDLITLSSKPDEAQIIFEYWCNVMKKKRSAFSPKRKKVIEARLKDGYPADEIKTAIVNCSNTPHNMGRNDNNKEYNDIELICRSSEKLEQFRDNQGVTNEAHQQSNQSYADTIHEQAIHAIKTMESGNRESSDGHFLDDF